MALGALLLTQMHAPDAQAAEWMRPATFSKASAELHVDAAMRMLRERPTELGAAGIDFSVARSHARRDGTHTVWLQQMHRGLVVMHKQVGVHFDRRGDVARLIRDLAPELSVSVTPTIAEGDAIAAVESFVGRTVDGHAPWLAVTDRDGAGGRLIWVVDAWQAPNPSQAGGHRYWIDAHTGQLVHHRPLGHAVDGRVYPISWITTPDPEDRELAELDVLDPQKLTGFEGLLRVVNYLAGSVNDGSMLVEQELLPSDGIDFLYDPPPDATDPTDAFAQVNAYYHLARAREFYSAMLGVDMSDPSWQVTVVANLQNYGNPTDNAFFSQMGIGGPVPAPNLIGIGQGAVFDFASDSDVFIHEFTHYATHNASGYNLSLFHTDSYGFSPFSGSIDEGLSDYFACTMNGDPVLGDASLAASMSARDLSDTSKSCPNDIVGEVHADGEIIGSFAWTLREEFGANLADRLIWDTVLLLPLGANFEDFRQALLQTADDMVLNGDLDATQIDFIEERLAARGLDDCGRIISVVEGEPRVQGLMGLNFVGALLGTSCGVAVSQYDFELQSLFQLAYEVPEDESSARIYIELESSSGPFDYDVIVNKGEPVLFASLGLVPEALSPDYVFSDLEDGSAELVIDADSDPPFEAGETYYISVVHRNCPSSKLTVGVAEPLSTGTGGEGGAGGSFGGPTGVGSGGEGGEGGDGAGVTGSDDGCDCRAAAGAGSRSSGGLALGGLLLAGLMWRRRRRA